MEEGHILEPYHLSYSDLIALSSDTPSSSSSSSSSSSASLEAVRESLGPTGAGLLAITGVPGASALRTALLPLARQLALLPNHLRNPILKEHCLGSDVPLKNLDRLVSSFAMQLKYEHFWELAPSILQNTTKQGPPNHEPTVTTTSDYDSKIESLDDKFKNLGSRFKELGFCMIHLGLRLARVCDRAIGGQELEKSLLESCTAKGRLVHYHSPLDTQLIKAAAGIKRSNRGRLKHQMKRTGSGDHECAVNDKCFKKKPVELWQQWHYDYGVLTVLTSPMFISTHYDPRDDGRICDMRTCECPLPASGHSCLQIVDPNTNKVCTMKAPPESFIVQVGESADILSKGKLRSTLHSVCRSVETEKLSRETFVVFLQPAWTKVFDLTDYPMERRITNGQDSARTSKGFQDDEQKQKNEGIHNVIPPLRSRLKSGMTFAEFSLETTKQYYGGGGQLQPNS